MYQIEGESMHKFFGKDNGIKLWDNVLVEDLMRIHIVMELIKRKRSQ
jgi:hypothetical protein